MPSTRSRTPSVSTIGFYNTTAFNQSPAGLAGTPIALTAAQQANIGKFLRTLNVSFNCQLAMKRINGAISVIDSFQNQSLAVQNGLLNLALAEVNDAIDLLTPFPLFYLNSRIQLTVARSFLQTAATQTLVATRRAFAQTALTQVTTANTNLGTGLGFNMGAGTLMF